MPPDAIIGFTEDSVSILVPVCDNMDAALDAALDAGVVALAWMLNAAACRYALRTGCPDCSQLLPPPAYSIPAAAANLSRILGEFASLCGGDLHGLDELTDEVIVAIRVGL